MKRFLFSMAMFSFLVTSCQTNETEQVTQGNVPEDVVDIRQQMTNLERFYTFVENVNQMKQDQIKVVRYTIEGDPIYHTLAYDGKVIQSTIDTTQDKFGSGKITTNACKSIAVVETEESTDYTLSECDRTDVDTSIINIRK
jgi:Domain of unknown function (DUF4362)